MVCLDGGDKGRVEEREREDDWNILKIRTFYVPSTYSATISAISSPCCSVVVVGIEDLLNALEPA
jgi:hypothetical protein